ncbi:MAG TPA: lysoplasmalogenase [Myxococcota bacterium]|nr:lysoplasmalogenase [Myxococcota bacterium]
MLAAALGAAVALLLVAEYRESALGVWVAKPLASALFVAAALAHGALGSGYGQLVLAALALSWLGDVLLIPAGRPAVFQAGIAAFALAHLAYAVAFAKRGFDPARAALCAGPAALALVWAARWLRPHLPAAMKGPVRAYMGILSAMLVASAGASAADPRIFAGGALFYLSDLTVARDRFVVPGFANGAVGLPLYYAAQLVLALTVSIESAR